MLVITRKPSQVTTIRVPPSTTEQVIQVAVVQVAKSLSRVRLGFEAAREVVIHREEVDWKVLDEKEKAAKAAGLAGGGELPAADVVPFVPFMPGHIEE